MNQSDKPSICQRCGSEADRLYNNEYVDEDNGTIIQQKICWDCDFDLMNGGDQYEDEGEIMLRRAENAYEYDPINNPRPY